MIRRRSLALLASATLLASSSGCMFWIVGTRIEGGENLPASALAAIGPETPAREVLERLGPPTAVARGGERLELPAFHLRRAGSSFVEADGLFARFKVRGPGDLLYLYEATRFVRPGSYVVFFFFAAGEATRGSTRPDEVRTERLLVLVDGARRVVREVRCEVEEVPRRERATPCGGRIP